MPEGADAANSDESRDESAFVESATVEVQEVQAAAEPPTKRARRSLCVGASASSTAITRSSTRPVRKVQQLGGRKATPLALAAAAKRVPVHQSLRRSLIQQFVYRSRSFSSDEERLHAASSASDSLRGSIDREREDLGARTFEFLEKIDFSPRRRDDRVHTETHLPAVSTLSTRAPIEGTARGRGRGGRGRGRFGQRSRGGRRGFTRWKKAAGRVGSAVKGKGTGAETGVLPSALRNELLQSEEHWILAEVIRHEEGPSATSDPEGSAGGHYLVFDVDADESSGYHTCLHILLFNAYFCPLPRISIQ